MKNKRQKQPTIEEVLGLEAHDILKTEGLDVLIKRAEQAGIGHKSIKDNTDLQGASDILARGFQTIIEAMQENKATRDEAFHVTGETGSPGRPDPERIIPDDQQRLDMKRRALAVPADLHERLLNILGADPLEDVYTNAAGHVVKALNSQEMAQLLHQTALDMGLTEPLIAGIMYVLGESALEQIVSQLMDSAVFGKGIKALKSEQPAPQTINHPVWGKINV